MASTINLKGMQHGEREKKIFPALEELKKDETLRLIVEFNPMPLVYMLKARNEFNVKYEKEGPDEWILAIKRTTESPRDERKEQFKKLLKELKKGKVTEKTKQKAKKILRSVDAKTLTLMEQELIREGVSHEEIRKSLCDIHLEVLRDTLVKKRIEVKAPHPVHTFMEEHKIIIDSLNELSSLVKRLKNKKSFKDMTDDLEKLKEIAHHLIEAESHHQREEEILFPKLREHDIVEPPDIMQEEHVEFKQKKQELYKLAQNPEEHSFKDFKKKAIQLGQYLSQELESHIFKEDNILYQIALQVLSRKEWGDIKKECDKIGYCCFTPEDKK